MFSFNKNLFNLLTVIYLLIFPIAHIAAQTCDSCKFIHYETEPNLLVYNALDFNNEMVVMLAKYADGTGTSTNCIDPKFELRYVHGDGTVENSTLNYIPSFNFCPGPDELYPFYIEQLSEYILISYVNPESASFYALLVNKTGEVVSDTLMGPVPIINGSMYPSGTLKTHITQDGFIFAYYDSETTIAWKSFRLNNDKKIINEVNTGRINLETPFSSYYIFPGIDGNFAFINTTTSTFASQTPTNPTLEIFISYITHSNTVENIIKGPYLIYQSTIPNLTLGDISCNTFTNTEYYCGLLLNENPAKRYLLKISFLYPSIITETKEFFRLEDLKNDIELRLGTLKYEGILLSKIDSVSLNYEGIVIDKNGISRNWDLPTNMTIPNNFQVVENKNGTMNFISDINENSWTIISSPLPLENSTSYDYGIKEVLSSNPSINTTVQELNTISFTYDRPVILSNHNNISIFNEENILRQNVLDITTSADFKTVSATVLGSTFNRAGSYRVVVDDGIIKDLRTDQPLIGFSWSFTIAPTKSKYAGDATGKLALTSEGSDYFQKLADSKGQVEFLFQMRQDLATALQVHPDRLGELKKFDSSDSSQTIFSLPIFSTSELLERNVDGLVKDLDVLIKEKKITIISWLSTNFLDPSFGFQEDQSIFGKYYYHIIALVVMGVMLIAAFVYLRKKNPEGNNFIIFKFVLTLVDLISDLAFVIKTGTKVKSIFLQSLLVTVLPFGFNFLVSALLVRYQIRRHKKFRVWFRQNSMITAAFTVLAGTDVDALNMLSSKFAGIGVFEAPFSKGARRIIFWVGLLGILIEDLPQFIVQVNNVSLSTPEVIPMITFSISAITLMINAVCKFYVAYAGQHEDDENDESDEDTGEAVEEAAANEEFEEIELEEVAVVVDELENATTV